MDREYRHTTYTNRINFSQNKLNAYSYFEKRCRKKRTQVHAATPKGSMGKSSELLHVMDTNV